MPRVLKLFITTIITIFGFGLILSLFGIPIQLVIVVGLLIFLILIRKELFWCIKPSTITQYAKGELSIMHMIGFGLGWMYTWGLIFSLIILGLKNTYFFIPGRIVGLVFMLLFLIGIVMKIVKLIKKL